MASNSHPNLIPGEVYYGTFDRHSSQQDYLMLAVEEGADYRTNIAWLSPYRKAFGHGALEPPRFTILRQATALEKEWLLESKKANKYVEMPTDYIINQFPIY
jgi:hypothetical protein